MQLGLLKKIDDLRLVWAHEALEFTPWLAKPENIKLLGETIGLDIEVEEEEKTFNGPLVYVEYWLIEMPYCHIVFSAEE